MKCIFQDEQGILIESREDSSMYQEQIKPIMLKI